jgi:hypothetical protein
MSVASDEFLAGMGPADPATPNGLHFGTAGMRAIWKQLHADIGSGWYRDGFFYLFGEGLDALRPCLEAWSFLLPPCEDRMIVGRNAYGAILVLENSNKKSEAVKILDPFTVTYSGDPNMMLLNMIANWMPQGGWYGMGQLPAFLDDRVYNQWRQQHGLAGARLDFDDMLGAKVPRPLGGTLTADNLQLEPITDYYRTTGPIYAEALRAKEAGDADRA